MCIGHDQRVMIFVQVIGLQGGALLGVTYKMPRRASSATLGPSGSSLDDPSVITGKGTEAPANFQLYRWCIVLLHSFLRFLFTLSKSLLSMHGSFR